MAAITGVSIPCNAKKIPTVLYINARIKLDTTILMLVDENRINSGSNCKASPLRIASDEGEN
jgi:hypothetical protein